MSNVKTIRDAARSILANQGGCSIEGCGDLVALADLDIDQLDEIGITLELEDEFDISLGDLGEHGIHSFKTIGGLLDHVEALVARKAAA